MFHSNLRVNPSILRNGKIVKSGDICKCISIIQKHAHYYVHRTTQHINKCEGYLLFIFKSAKEPKVKTRHWQSSQPSCAWQKTVFLWRDLSGMNVEYFSFWPTLTLSNNTSLLVIFKHLVVMSWPDAWLHNRDNIGRTCPVS